MHIFLTQLVEIREKHNQNEKVKYIDNQTDAHINEVKKTPVIPT